MNRIRICIVTEEAIPPVQRFSLSLRLAETLGQEFEVHLVALSSSINYLPKNVIFHPVEVRGWNLFSIGQRIRAILKLAFRVYRVCRRYKIDLIYGGWTVVFLPAIICAKPFAVDMPEFIEQMYRSFCKPLPHLMKFPLMLLQTAVAKKSKAILTESLTACEEWRRRGIKEDKLYWIPYGVEIDIFQAPSLDKIRERYNIPQANILVMYHGDIGLDDGVDLLIQAVKDLDIWCIIIGNGPPNYMNFLKRKAGPRTIFTGWILYSQIPQYLSSCDIYVAPFKSSLYTNSTFPLKQMESMAAGKATICSRLEAFSKVVKDGYDIKLITAGSIAELKKAIQELIENESFRKTLGYNASGTAKKEFDWRLRVDKEIKIIKDILTKI